MKILFENFATLADAPNGVPKLREMILQLAVQGKLVPQDPNDEPACELLKRIRAEKEEMIEAGQIKRKKTLSEIRNLEKPFSIPSKWHWTRLFDIVFLLGDGLHGTPNYTPNTECFFVNGNNLANGKIIIRPNTKTVSFEEMQKYKKFFTKNTVLVSINGTLGNVAFYNNEKIILGKSACFFNLAGNISKYFMKIILESPYFLSYAFNNATGSTIKNLPLSAMNNFPVPLPPLVEQTHIVAKVDQLMALCDELEKQQEQRAKKHVNLHKAVIHQLLESRTPDVFSTNWQRIEQHFELLYSVPENVTELKQAILQLAVQGKLVPQNPNDEPARVLLEKIKTEKEKRIAAGEIKRENPLPPIREDEKPFDLPEGWEWTRLGVVTNYGYADKIESNKLSGDTWVLELEDIEKITSRLLNKIRYKERNSKSTKNVFYKNDVLYGKLRPYLNKVLVVDENGVCTTEILPLRGFNAIFPQFLCISLKCPAFVNYATNSTHGMNLPRLGTEKGRNALFALPPLAEQTRIATKVSSLLQMCDELATQLTQSRQQAERLMNAVVQAAVGR